VIDTLQVGGAQSLLVTLAQKWPPERARPDVITLQEIGATGPGARLVEAGAHVMALPGRGLLDGGRFRRLVSQIRAGGYDAVHTHLAYANIAGLAAARLAKRPAVATLHNVRPSHQPATIIALEGLALRCWARLVVAVGPQVAATYRSRWPGLAIEVLPNAVTAPAPMAAGERLARRRALLGDGEGPLLLAAGRLTRQKGYPDLLAAFDHVRPLYAGARLLIAGGGPDEAAIAGEIRQRRLGAAVRLLGRRDDVPELMQAADLFVSASHWEGLPVAVLEAMAAGLAVVATAVGDVPEVVTAESGILVPPRQPAALAAAIVALLADPERRASLGAAGAQRVASCYGAEAWVARLLALYHRLLAVATTEVA
jgi:glycosyltransferase involved in cell wall biosynthesis